MHSSPSEQAFELFVVNQWQLQWSQQVIYLAMCVEDYIERTAVGIEVATLLTEGRMKNDLELLNK